MCNLRNACTMILKSANRLSLLPFTLGANTFSKKGHNLTTIVVSNGLIERSEFLEKKKEEEGKEKKITPLNLLSSGCFSIIHKFLAIFRGRIIRNRIGFSTRAIKHTARVTLLLLTRGWIPILFSRSSRFHRDIEERGEIAGISRHLLTKRARSLSARPSLYLATRPFAFVLTSPRRPFPPRLLDA